MTPLCFLYICKLKTHRKKKPEKYICVVCSKRQSKFRCGRCHSVTYRGRECQKKDLKRHKKLCAPVVYKKFDERGRGLMATKDFKQGDIVFKDKASITLQHDNHQSKIERGNIAQFPKRR